MTASPRACGGWAAVALLSLLAQSGCHRATRRPPDIPGAGVPGADLAAAVASLCQARDQAGHETGAARDTFYVVAHQRLHLEAQALAEVDRPAAGRLLIDMQRVEADLAPQAAAPALAADLATLATTAAAGLTRLAVPAPRCAS